VSLPKHTQQNVGQNLQLSFAGQNVQVQHTHPSVIRISESSFLRLPLFVISFRRDAHFFVSLFRSLLHDTTTDASSRCPTHSPRSFPYLPFHPDAIRRSSFLFTLHIIILTPRKLGHGNKRNKALTLAHAQTIHYTSN